MFNVCREIYVHNVDPRVGVNSLIYVILLQYAALFTSAL